ncbi:protein CHLOROPLAST VESICULATION [Lactuca sativa]|uniref:Uncharacterized protein n=1 Tax=Lactuca sativa TaxID=4236 RepID=A0A9R1WLE5_LACSA|nr:protein CHLOROPLAST VESICULATION [Lactuca sativa]KAJ0227551.1 hypothetical protein LSAT_V11C100018850 [Lactuca sativa]
MVMMTTSCCFNPRPPTVPPATTSTSQPPSCVRPKKEVSWRNQCVVGMACVIIGLQVEGIVVNNHDYAVAIEPKVVASKIKGKRWSGKRICPAWQLNSLETIVPEDLPRPYHRRRWEEIGDDLSRVAPPVKASPTTITAASSACFSM